MKFLVLWHFDIAAAPVYNFATYEVLPLAEMTGPATVVSSGART